MVEVSDVVVLASMGFGLFFEDSDNDDFDDEDVLQFFKIHLHSGSLQKFSLNTESQETTTDLNELFTFDDGQFMEHLRVNRSTFECLATRLASCWLDNVNLPCVTVEKQLLIFLWSLGSDDTYRSIGERFGICEWTVQDCFLNVCRTLNSISNEVISWPKGQRAVQIIQDFNYGYGLPGVLGVIGTTHIPVKTSKQCLATQSNTSGHYPSESVILQAVCDHSMKFSDFYMERNSSLNNADMFWQSPLSHAIADNTKMYFKDSHLIGSVSFPLLPYLLVPFEHDGSLTRAQVLYNNKLKAVGTKIGNAFALLKGRFGRLKNMKVTMMDSVTEIITAACVLHNLCVDYQDNMYIEWKEKQEDPELEQSSSVPDALAKRQRIVEQLGAS